MYRSIVINEAVTTAIGTIDSCYVVLDSVGCNEFKDLEAFYALKVYMNKATYEADDTKHIIVDEIKNFTKAFTQDFVSGADLFQKISQEVVYQLCDKNDWDEDNLIIE